MKRLTLMLDYGTIELLVKDYEHGKQVMKDYTKQGFKIKGFAYEV